MKLTIALGALVLGTGAFFVPRASPLAPSAVPLCRLYLDPDDKFTRVVPDDATLSALQAGATQSSIAVNYSSGFTGPAQLAFQAAVDIWKTQVQSPVSIVVDANFVDFGNPLLLGVAAPGCRFTDFPGNIRIDTWFPSAIANRLSGNRNPPMLGCSGSDISATFNSAANWSYGTDGVPVSGKVDFESVVLHELAHGLGFFGAAAVNANGQGTVGEGFPYIFDANVVDSAGTSILAANVYPNGSASMASLLTGTGASGQGLFWGGASGVAAGNGAAPRLYAPPSFLNGSSYVHLDEATYPAGDVNSLMTFRIGTAEVIHTPGPIVLGMFGDMGWRSQTAAACSDGLDRNVADVPASGGVVAVEVVAAAGCPWTAASSSSFVSGVTPASGTSSARVQMTVAQNSSANARAGTVTIGTETFTIAQQGTTPCAYSLGAGAATFPPSGGTGSVSLTAAAGCAWTASSSDASVASVATDPPAGQGSASIDYSAKGNTGPSARTAVLTIGGQPFTVTEQGCTYGIAQTTYPVGGGSGTLDVGVSTVSPCAWTAATSSAFVSLQSNASVSGSGTVRFGIASNPSLTPRTGTVTVAGQTVTIAQGPGLPTMAADTPFLGFGATRSSVAFTAQTGTQSVRLLQSGLPGTVTWTASSNQPWLTVSPGSGTGGATLRVAVAFDPSLPMTGVPSGTITVALNGANTAVALIPVTLNVIAVPQAPFGTVDTPSDGSTGVEGAMALTGWALDDVQVSRVTICRDPMAGDALIPDARCGGLAKIYVGDASFVDGARPDVQGAFAGWPMSARAGWGYLLLTDFLPNLGNGPFVLSAFASDLDGHSTLLGARRISCDNAHATAPFGAIDTPAPGEVVRGVVPNFGWVLSPGFARADPPGGGAVTVLIDGVAVGSPSGWTNRGDLDALFPAAQFTGVGTALGVFTIDTTRLSNGVHTLAWVVTDSLGVTSGVGSRYFVVANGS